MIVASLVLILVAVTLLVLGLASGSSELLVSSIGASLLAAVALVVGARQAAAARSGTGSNDHERSRAGDEDDESRVFHHRSTARAERRSAAWGAGDSSVAVADPVEAPVPPQGTYRSATAAPEYGTGYPGPYSPEPAFDDPYPPEPQAPFRSEPAGHRSDDAYRSEPAPSAFRSEVPPSGDPDDDDDDDEADGGDPPDEPAAQYVAPADAARVARMTAPVLVIDGRPRYHLAGCVHLLGREGEPLPVGEAVELGFTPCSLCEPDSALVAESRRV